MTTVVSSIQVTQNSGLKLGSSSNVTTIVNTASGAQSLTLPNATDTIVARGTTDTLTNKTLTSPVISTIVNTGTLTLPTSSDTLVGRATTDTLTNKTLTSPVISTISNTGTLTLPTSTDTLVGRATTDTLTNKTLTAPVISTISNTGTLTLPTSTDTLVGRATSDTLTNKTIVGGANGNSVTASSLGTTGIAVTINTNTPSTGQILVATSTSNATWQTIPTNIPGVIDTSQTLQTTTAATNQLLETVTVVPSADTIYVSTKVIGFNTTTPGTIGGAVFDIKATFVLNAGTITIINTPSAVCYAGAGFTAGDGYTFGDVTLAISGTSILIQVNGQSGQTINWKSATTTMVA